MMIDTPRPVNHRMRNFTLLGLLAGFAISLATNIGLAIRIIQLH